MREREEAEMKGVREVKQEKQLAGEGEAGGRV